MVYMKYSSWLTGSCIVQKQHYFVYKLLQAVDSCGGAILVLLDSLLHLTLMIMKNLLEYLIHIVADHGPELFTIYATHVGRIIQRHDLIYHPYAETQIYMAFKPSDTKSKHISDRG